MQTHELANLLLSMPNVPALIEMPGYDGDGRMIEVTRVNLGDFCITKETPPQETGDPVEGVLIA